jgi:hypothetical protein
VYFAPPGSTADRSVDDADAGVVCDSDGSVDDVVAADPTVSSPATPAPTAFFSPPR